MFVCIFLCMLGVCTCISAYERSWLALGIFFDWSSPYFSEKHLLQYLFCMLHVWSPADQSKWWWETVYRVGLGALPRVCRVYVEYLYLLSCLASLPPYCLRQFFSLNLCLLLWLDWLPPGSGAVVWEFRRRPHVPTTSTLLSRAKFREGIWRWGMPSFV